MARTKKPKVPKSIEVLEKETKRSVGRPVASGSKLQLDAELIKKITTVLKIGSYVEIAAAINGVGYSTMREWILKSRAYPDSVYAEFARAAEKAMSEAETRDLAVIDLHAQGRDAIYEYDVVMEPVLDNHGNPVFGMNMEPMQRPMKDSKGDPVRQIARDGEGNPILKRSELKAQWQAAAWKLERRNPARWGRSENEERNKIFEPEAATERAENKHLVVTELKIRAVIAKLENDY